MFPRHKRLNSAKDITTVYRKGKKALEDGVLVSVFPAHGDTNRINVTVSKKFSTKAVARNAQKRNLLHAAETLEDDILKKSDITISYNKSARMLSYEESRTALEKAFRKLNLL